MGTLGPLDDTDPLLQHAGKALQDWLAAEEAPALPDGYHPGCSNQHCLCWRPGVACEEFMGADEGDFCPRCGWLQLLHLSADVEAVNP